jgi:hypothetical protein
MDRAEGGLLSKRSRKSSLLIACPIWAERPCIMKKLSPVQKLVLGFAILVSAIVGPAFACDDDVAGSIPAATNCWDRNGDGRVDNNECDSLRGIKDLGK